eukprot:m.414360 g.414360  ORF g.414360 m.414360 type:complete len:84 (+) comp56592_c0_seq5:937-1188(+)
MSKSTKRPKLSMIYSLHRKPHTPHIQASQVMTDLVFPFSFFLTEAFETLRFRPASQLYPYRRWPAEVVKERQHAQFWRSQSRS